MRTIVQVYLKDEELKDLVSIITGFEKEGMYLADIQFMPIVDEKVCIFKRREVKSR